MVWSLSLTCTPLPKGPACGQHFSFMESYELPKIHESSQPALRAKATGRSWHQDIETEPFLEEQDPAQGEARKCHCTPNLLICGIIVLLWVLSIVVATQVATLRLGASLRYSFGNGFDTDLGKSYLTQFEDYNSQLILIIDPIRPVLEIQKLRFTGGLSFDINGTLIRTYSKNDTQYVGEPSMELDNAWNKLIEGIFIYSPKHDSYQRDKPSADFCDNS